MAQNRTFGTPDIWHKKTFGTKTFGTKTNGTQDIWHKTIGTMDIWHRDKWHKTKKKFVI